jgi:hypothetical protein
MKSKSLISEISNSLNVDGLEWLGEGMNGDAYKTNCGKCVKFTHDRYEVACAFELMNKDIDGYVNIFTIKKFKAGSYLILMDLLDVSHARDLFSKIEKLQSDLGIHHSEINYKIQDVRDYKELASFSKELTKVISNFESENIKLEDIQSGNIGYNSDKKLVLFDQQIFYKNNRLLQLLDQIENQDVTKIKLYHGTNEEFDSFSPMHVGNRLTSLGLAHYLTSDYELASNYGDNVMSFECETTNILDWDNLTSIKRLIIESKLLEYIPKDRIAGFGKEIEITVDENKEGLAKFRELQEKTSGYYHESARAQIKEYNEDNTITISYKVASGLKIANNQQLMTLMNEYCPNMASDLGYKCSKFSNQYAFYDSNLLKKISDNKIDYNQDTINKKKQYNLKSNL